MVNCPLTKQEMIDRLTKEYDRLIYNADYVKTDSEKAYYLNQAEYLKLLFQLLEIDFKPV